ARVATVRGEITAWKALHTKMWKALGLRPDRADDGAAAAEPQSAGEVELLASTVAEEGPRLKELEHATGRMGRLVSALPLSWPIHGQIDSQHGATSPLRGARGRQAGQPARISRGALTGSTGTRDVARCGHGDGRAPRWQQCTERARRRRMDGVTHRAVAGL